MRSGDSARPAVASSSEPAALLEREAELATLATAIARCRDGAGRLTVIEGPAGIGKSSVLAAARSRAEDAGLRVLHARGSELEAAFPYGIVRQLFEPIVLPADQSFRDRALAGAAAHAARLFDARPDTHSPQDRDETDFALVHGLYWLTVNLAEDQPLLIAIDDLQWADGSSLRWFAYLARRLDGLPVGAVAAIRPLEAENPVLTDLLVDPITDVLRPPALTASAVTELVRETLGPDSADGFCHECHRATGGNPLLVRELVRTLADEDIGPTDDSASIVGRLAPNAVTRSVKARLARLPPESAAVARAIAVLGDGADGRQVGALAELDPRTLAFAASALTRVELLLPSSSFQYVHPLVRTAVYTSIPVPERAQEHARAAALLAATNAPLDAVAAQLLLAPPGAGGDAAPQLHEAARAAADRGAPESAARYLQRALDEQVDDEHRGELLLDLGASELRLGRATAPERLREALPLVRDNQRRRQAYLDLALALNWPGDDEQAARGLQQALTEVQEGDDDLRRRIEAEWLAHAIWTPALTLDARRRLESMAFEDVEGVGAHMLLGMQAWHESTLGRNRERAIAQAERALSAIEAGRGDTITDQYSVFVLHYGDCFEQGVRRVDAVLAQARRRADVLTFATYMSLRAMFHYGTGALAEAEADARGGLETLGRADVMFVPFAYSWLAQVLVERGDLDEAADLIQTAGEVLGSVPEDGPYDALLRARGLVAAGRGDHRAALRDALTVGRIMRSVGTVNPAVSYPSWRSEAARAHHALGETADAIALASEDVELARGWGAPRALGRALRTLGSIKGGAQGLEHIREAVDVLADSRADLEHAYALADLGAALRRDNHRAAARDPLRQALELAQRCGATVLAARAHEELLAAGARPRRLQVTGVDALTPSERRVATMAADGMSNREIAQSLFVTLRTVETHLSGAFRKLGIASRTQLPDALIAEPRTITDQAAAARRA